MVYLCRMDTSGLMDRNYKKIKLRESLHLCPGDENPRGFCRVKNLRPRSGGK